MIELYTREGCVHCQRAKSLLQSKNIVYNEHMIDKDVSVDFVRGKFPNNRSLPIVVVNERVIGGADDLEKMITEYGNDFGKTFLTETI